jgi:hypothetical protein
MIGEVLLDLLAGSIGATSGPRMSARAAVAAVLVPAVCAGLTVLLYGHALAVHSWPPPFTVYLAAVLGFGLGYPVGGAARGGLYALLAAAVTFVLIGGIVLVQLMTNLPGWA